MNDFDININELNQFYKIKIKNPRYSKVSTEFISIKLNQFYRKYRFFLSKIFKESNSQKFMLDSFTDTQLDIYMKKKYYNAPLETLNGKTPYFKLKYINLFDVFQKENITSLKKGLNTFSKKHARLFEISKSYNTPEFENISYFLDSPFDILVASFSIKKESSLSEFVTDIQIRMSGLSSTLATLSFKLFISDKLTNLIEEICLTDMKTYKFCSPQFKKWNNIRQIGCTRIPGTRYKHKLKCIIEDEIKWRVMLELQKCIDLPVFQTNKSNIALSIFETNVDGNYSSKFWESIGILSHMCDYFKDFSGCMCWASEFSEDCYFIYYPNPKLNSEIYAFDIDERYRNYIVTQSILNLTRNKLNRYTQKASYYSKNNENIRNWLNLKKEMENELILSKRFIKEYNPIIFEPKVDFDDFLLLYRTESISKSLLSSQINNINDCRDTLISISSIINTNLDSLTYVSNYKLQKTTLLTNAISAILAFIAILFTLISTEEISNKVHNLFTLKTFWILIFTSGSLLFFYIISKIVKYLKLKKYTKDKSTFY